jgi:hypothetical protein
VPSEDGGLGLQPAAAAASGAGQRHGGDARRAGDGQRRPIPLLASLAPVLLGVAMFVITKSPMFLLFTLLSPVLMLSSWLTERRQGKRSYRQQLADYKRDLAEAKKKITEAGPLGAPDAPARRAGPGRRAGHRARSAPPAVGAPAAGTPTGCCCGWHGPAALGDRAGPAVNPRTRPSRRCSRTCR